MNSDTKDFRRVTCPVCGGLLCRVSGETSGAVEARCQRCKRIAPLQNENVAPADEEMYDLSSEATARLTSAEPNERHKARRASLGAYADYVEPELPDRPQVRDHSGEKRSLGKRILHRLEHGGKLALLGLQRGGVGGGVLGFSMGMASPKIADRAEHRLVLEPEYQAEVDRVERQAARRLGAAQDVAGMTGRTLEGGPTVAGQNANRQDAEFAFGVKKFGVEQTRQDENQKRLNSAQSLTRFKHFTDTAPPGTPIPKDLAEAAGLPHLSGSPVGEDRQTGEKTITDDVTGQIYILKDGKITPVVEGATGKPFSVTPKTPPAQQPPQYVPMGRARAELKRRMGIRDENAPMPNPEHDAYFQTLKAENEAAVREDGEDARLSDEALHARAAKKYPRTVRAGSLITPEMEREEAARMYQGKPSGPRPMTTPTKNADAPRTQKVGDEVMYGGKRHKVVGIEADGDLILEEVQ